MMSHDTSDISSNDFFKKSSGNMELFLKTGNRYEKLNLRQLLFIKAAGKYIELHFESGKRLLRVPLTNFLKEPLQIHLIRIHKSFAINTAYITSYSYQDVTVSGKKIPIGRSYKTSLFDYMKGAAIELNN